MGYAVALSLMLHVAVGLVAYYGIPVLRDDELLVDAPVVVEMVDISELTNLPDQEPQPGPEPEEVAEAPAPEPKPDPTPPPPPPPAPEPPAPPPPPEPEPAPPEPEPEPAPPPPEPEPAPPEPEPAPPEPEPAPPPPEPEPAATPPPPAPKPKPKPKPKPPEKLADVTPPKKPKPPDTWSSVLKTVEDLPDSPPPKREADKEPPKEAFQDQIARALSRSSRTYDAARPLSLSEIDAVRQQIAQCWNVPAGAKDAENLVVEIRVSMNPDGRVREARILDTGRMSEPFYRAAAESALRAVLNPRCSPLRLPADKYDQWKTMTLSFNPREMFGQ